MDIKILMALHRYHFTSKPFLLAIAKYPQWACWYAQYILKGPFKLGEPAIAKDPYWACWYAEEVLHLPEKQAEQWRG